MKITEKELFDRRHEKKLAPDWIAELHNSMIDICNSCSDALNKFKRKMEEEEGLREVQSLGDLVLLGEVLEKNILNLKRVHLYTMHLMLLNEPLRKKDKKAIENLVKTFMEHINNLKI